jgi:beta-lactamase regulating signal transducer with metallopeptidase domain
MSAFMLYGLVLTAFVAAATHFLDRGLRTLGRPTRWAWALGMATALGFLLASAAWGSSAETAPQEGMVPVEVLYDLLAGSGALSSASPTRSLSVDGPLTLLWLLGSVSLLAAALWAGRRLHRARRRWDKGLLGSQEVLVSEGLGPAVLGLIRPVIVVPPWVLELSHEKQEMILLHEKEHQDARDPALLVLALVMVAATPWNPALWWMARRLHLAVEGDCDARVLARGVPARRYGNLLLEVASGGRGLSALAPALAEGGETFLERRLLMIRHAVRKKGLLAAVLPMLLCAGFLALACETPTPPGAAEPELTIEPSEVPALEGSAVLTEVSEGEDGFFLVRKNAGKVDYVGPVSEGQLKLIKEGAGEEAGQGYLIRGAPEGEMGSKAVKIRATGGVEGGEEGPKPLIVVDGEIVSDPDFLQSMDKESIDRIEVIKGAAAEELYGERAAGGVIKIFTKR